MYMPLFKTSACSENLNNVLPLSHVACRRRRYRRGRSCWSALTPCRRWCRESRWWRSWGLTRRSVWTPWRDMRWPCCRGSTPEPTGDNLTLCVQAIYELCTLTLSIIFLSHFIFMVLYNTVTTDTCGRKSASLFHVQLQPVFFFYNQT